MKDQDIRALVSKYVSLDAEIKVLERKRDLLKEQIIALGEGAHRCDIGSASVTMTQRTLLDQKKLKEDFGDKLEPYYKTSNSITVRVTMFKTDEDA